MTFRGLEVERLLLCLVLFVLASALAMASLGADAGAAPYTGPVKELPKAHLGREVNLTEAGKGILLEDFCDEQADTCRTGKSSGISGGFNFPAGVVAQSATSEPTLFVADTVNDRVQRISSTGAFVSMFGGEVDATKAAAVKAKEAKGETPSASELHEENVCTAVSHDECQAGTPGGGAEAFDGDYSIALDQGTGNVFVTDLFNWRVDEYTEFGQFVLMIGKGVDATKAAAVKAKEAKGETASASELREENVCTAASGDLCGPGQRAAAASDEAGAFDYKQGSGDLLAVDSAEKTLFVGDEHRVQEFDLETGEAKPQISLASISAEAEAKVVALALDETTGELYVAYGLNQSVPTIEVFDSSGTLVRQFEVRKPASDLTTVRIAAMAVDAQGRLAVTEPFGSIYDAIYDGLSGRRETEFVGASEGISFNALGEADELYAATPTSHEIEGYRAVHVADLTTAGSPCKSGADEGSSATLDCTLKGEVNPEEVAQTEVWLQWGPSEAFGKETSRQPVTTGGAPVGVEAAIQRLHPNTQYFYRLDASDQNEPSPPETPLTSETASFRTETVPPRSVGAPQAPHVRTSSAVLFGQLNPEKDATRYSFRYGPCASVAACPSSPYPDGTNTLESALYGTIGATFEVTGLQPASVYHYRLVAENGSKQTATGNEGVFQTPATASPRAETGGASAIGPTGASISGTVYPEGEPASYAFELGVYEGAATSYGVVYSAGVPAVDEGVGESLALTGLQPGTAYAYRIRVSSPGFGDVQGAPATFVTQGLPEALPQVFAPPLLSVPHLNFPKVVQPLTRARKLALALKACRRDRRARRRVRCERAARTKYRSRSSAK